MLKRWWIYQAERFPVFAHGVLIAAFSLSAVCYSALLRGEAALPGRLASLVAFGSAFLFFLQLRIADEFKDFEEDCRYRPYRPVPRGLISLRELGTLGVLSAAVQVGFVWLLLPEMALLLVLVWGYLGLMSKELFAGSWLRARPVLYLLSHMAILPLVDLYATACDWWPAGTGPPRGLSWFLAVSYFNGVVLEIGRKIRAPRDEEHGVNTYSRLWGRWNAVLVWFGALLITAACAGMAAGRIGFCLPAVGLMVILLVAAAMVAGRFLRDPVQQHARGIETLSGVWTLLMYLSLGIIPLVWRWWSTQGTVP